MVQDTWPLPATQNTFSFSELETGTVRQLWKEKAPQLFCDEEEEMLVENGKISSHGE